MTRPTFPEEPVAVDTGPVPLRPLLDLDYAPTRGIGRPCEATVIFYGPDAPHIKSEEIRGMCDYEAKGFRDGRAACGRHLRSLTVDWCHPEPHEHGSAKDAWNP